MIRNGTGIQSRPQVGDWATLGKIALGPSTLNGCASTVAADLTMSQLSVGAQGPVQLPGEVSACQLPFSNGRRALRRQLTGGVGKGGDVTLYLDGKQGDGAKDANHLVSEGICLGRLRPEPPDAVS
jgi:hypothetical protein